MTKLIQFSTPSCGQCPQQEEILQELAVDRTDVEFEKINATEEVEKANKYSVRSVPSTIVLADDGSVVSKFDGLSRLTKSRVPVSPDISFESRALIPF